MELEHEWQTVISEKAKSKNDTHCGLQTFHVKWSYVAVQKVKILKARPKKIMNLSFIEKSTIEFPPLKGEDLLNNAQNLKNFRLRNYQKTFLDSLEKEYVTN